MFKAICRNPACRTIFNVPPSHQARGRGKYCSRACWKLIDRPPLAMRLWRAIQRCDHDQDCLYCCWLWQGTTNPDGYGRIGINNHMKLAHRMAWELWHNQIMPPHLDAAHYCHTPPCCNPFHIHPATRQQNCQEAIDVNRHSFGERHGRSKFKETDIALIFAYAAQGLSQGAIARQFQVHPSTISLVLHGKLWKHLNISNSSHQPSMEARQKTEAVQ